MGIKCILVIVLAAILLIANCLMIFKALRISKEAKKLLEIQKFIEKVTYLYFFYKNIECKLEFKEVINKGFGFANINKEIISNANNPEELRNLLIKTSNELVQEAKNLELNYGKSDVIKKSLKLLDAIINNSKKEIFEVISNAKSNAK